MGDRFQYRGGEAFKRRWRELMPLRPIERLIIEHALSSTDLEAIRDVAQTQAGNELLSGTNWVGKMDFADDVSMAVHRSYVENARVRL